jgi:hypothetical protein
MSTVLKLGGLLVSEFATYVVKSYLMRTFTICSHHIKLGSLWVEIRTRDILNTKQPKCYEISGSYVGEYEDGCLQGCCAM